MKELAKPKKLLQIVSSIWIVIILSIFWFNIRTISNHCGLWQGCINIFGKHWKIYLIPGHKFYIDLYRSIADTIIEKPHVPAPVFLILAVILFVYFANFLYDRIIEKKKELHFKITPFAVFLIFTGIFALCLNRWLAYFLINQPIRYESIWLRYPAVIAKSSVILLVMVSVGLKVKNLLLKEKIGDNNENVLRNCILSFAFGLMVLVLPLYFLGLFKLLLFKYVLLLLIFLLLISVREAIYWVKIFFTKKFEFKSNFLDPSIFLFLIALVFMAHNLIELIRPYPMGFDDLNVYVNNPRIMAEAGTLISGIMSYYWELFASLGFIMYKNTEMALILSFFGSVVSYLGIYYIIKFYCKEKGLTDRVQRIYAALCATLFYTFPSVVFQSTKDVKVDLGAIAVTFAALIFFWEWRKKMLQDGKLKGNLRLLLLAALLSGFAFAIKYTNALFIAVLILYTFWTLTEIKESIKKRLIIIVYFGLFALILVMPITIRNIFQTNSVSIASLRFGDQSSQEIKINPSFKPGNYIANQQKYMREKSTGKREELGRYTGYNSFVIKYLKLPLGMLQNRFIEGSFVDLGYVIPVFVPLIFLFIKRIRKEDKNRFNNIIQLVALTATFWLLWMFSASGVIWYGYSGLIFIFILFVEVNLAIRKYFSKWFIYLTNILITFWLITAICMRLGFLANIGLGIEQVGLMYARGQITAEDYRKMKFNPYLPIIDDINKTINENPENPPKTFMIGSFYKYLFDRNDKSIVFDHIFDIFMYTSQDGDYNKTLERMRNSGIQYILFDRSMGGLDKTPDRSIIKKYNAFVDFINANLDNLELLSDPKDPRYLFVKIR